MKVKELIQYLQTLPPEFEVNVGGEERGSGGLKYLDCDNVDRSVTLWNCTRTEVTEIFGITNETSS